jgi:Kef-type K+ transport system membrane component KefB
VIGRAGRSTLISGALRRLQDTTAQIRVRGAVLLLVGVVAIAERLGLEVILGAFSPVTFFRSWTATRP